MKTPEQLAEYLAAARSWRLNDTDAELLLDALGDEPTPEVAWRRERQRNWKRQAKARSEA